MYPKSHRHVLVKHRRYHRSLGAHVWRVLSRDSTLREYYKYSLRYLHRSFHGCSVLALTLAIVKLEDNVRNTYMYLSVCPSQYAQ
jgi:hypothetical protein